MARKSYRFCAALLFAVFLLAACDGSSDNDSNGYPLEPDPNVLAGTYWWWPSLQLFFISPDRVMLYSTGAYYPYEGSPFRYTYAAPGYAYSYTYNPLTKSGRINDIGEYTGGSLGDFIITADNQNLYFSNYKSYGHDADFVTLRPAPAEGYSFSPLPDVLQPSDVRDTLWAGTAPGADFGTWTGSLIIIHFTSESGVYVTRTCNVVTGQEKQRFFTFSLTGAAGNIGGIGDFTIAGAEGTLTFADFPGAGNVVFSRIR
jgi:hypothetical protein